MPKKISRRKFIEQANCAAIGSISLFSSLLSLRLTAGAMSKNSFNDYKAIVCLFLNGGNDSYNMLMPRNHSAYDEYRVTRGDIYNAQSNPTGLAFDLNTLEDMAISTEGQSYSEFGVHPNLPYLRNLYNQGDLAFVSNVGSLIRPTTLNDYDNDLSIPKGLFSHSDHQIHWQTLVPQVKGSSPKGWGGRVSEMMESLDSNLINDISMNISLSGSNILQTGNSSVPYITSDAGAIELFNYGAGYDPVITSAVNDIMSHHYQNIYKSTLSNNKQGSIEAANIFKEAIAPYMGQSLEEELGTSYTNTSAKLSMIPRIIRASQPGAASSLNMNRQIFFVERGGWDHHQEGINAQSDLFSEINNAIELFWEEIRFHGLENNVLLYTASDFGRTLSSNGNGTDHAWGGNHFIISGSAIGGKVYGQYPSLAIGSENDIGRGRLLPTTSIDEYMAEIINWFGVPASELSTVIPNINNFSSSQPLGIFS
tara:strand:- start:1150 stop:2589 length:1440 start_codon:yes stop_codon:yes gene_type:complete